MLQQNPRDLRALTGENTHHPLDRLDVLLGKLGMGLEPEEALEIPALLDQVYLRMEQLDPESQGGKAAAAEFEAHSQTYKKQLATFLREVGDPARLDEARKAARPTAERWWWQPEQMLAAERKGSLKQSLRKFGIAAGILAVLVIVYQLFLRPDPSVIAVLDARRDAETMAVDGQDPAGALERVELGLTQVPGNGELLVLKGCLLTILGGSDAEAQEAFAAGEKALGSREYLLLMSAQNYSILWHPQLAQASAEAAIALNPNSAQGYLILGQALEDQKDQDGAYKAYETASALGMEYEDPTITAQARMKMGILLQSMNLMPQLDELMPTATP